MFRHAVKYLLILGLVNFITGCATTYGRLNANANGAHLDLKSNLFKF